MLSFRFRKLPGLRAVLTLAVLTLTVSAASAGLRDVRVSGDAAVRSWAARNAPAVEVVRTGGFVTLEGSVEAPWFRVRTTTGRSGWIAGTIAEGLLTADENLATKPTLLSGSLRLLTKAELRGGPVLGRPVQHELAPGTIVRVLDQYGTWVLLGDTQGRSGWSEASTFVAATVDGDAAATPAPRARTADAKTSGRKAPEVRDEAAATDEASADEAAGPTGAELRRIRLEERRAAREAADAEDAATTQDAEAERDARKAAAEQRRAERRAAKEAERAEAQAAKEAERAAKIAAKEARAAEEASAKVEEAEAVAAVETEPADDAALAREAKAAERRAAREAKEAERQAAREAKEAEKRAAREAKEAEKQAALDAKAAEKDAAAAAVSEPAGDEDRSEEEAAAAKRREREEAAARKAEAREAKEQEKRAAREAKEAERLAKKEAKQRGKEEPVRAAPPVVQVQEVPDGPVAPADIPASLGVSLGKKAPAEKKPDPQMSPLASEVFTPRSTSERPVIDAPSQATPQAPRDAAAAELLEGFQPYDESRQVGRSVEAVHDDPQEAMDLSFAKRPTAQPSSFYVNDEGDMVDTRVVSEIVLRVGSEILTLGEFERRVEETREAESVRSGSLPSLDEARRKVLAELVDSLVLIHHGRALGIRFDAVYESAKEDFKKSGRISDDLELLRLLDEMGMTFKDFRREMIRRTVPQIVVRTQVMSDVTVAEDEIDNYYRRHQDEWVQEDCVRLRELVLQPEARETTRDFNLRLEEILKRVEAGEDFCDLARRHSRSPSATDCGQLNDCFSFEQLDEKVARVVFKMRPGDIEPIRTDWGYHLLRLEEHRPRRVRGLEEVRSAILRKLQLERLGNEVPRFIEDLRRTVRIEIAPAFQRYWSEAGARGGLGQ